MSAGGLPEARFADSSALRLLLGTDGSAPGVLDADTLAAILEAADAVLQMPSANPFRTERSLRTDPAAAAAGGGGASGGEGNVGIAQAAPASSPAADGAEARAKRRRLDKGKAPAKPDPQPAARRGGGAAGAAEEAAHPSCTRTGPESWGRASTLAFTCAATRLLKLLWELSADGCFAAQLAASGAMPRLLRVAAALAGVSVDLSVEQLAERSIRTLPACPPSHAKPDSITLPARLRGGGSAAGRGGENAAAGPQPGTWADALSWDARSVAAQAAAGPSSSKEGAPTAAPAFIDSIIGGTEVRLPHRACSVTGRCSPPRRSDTPPPSLACRSRSAFRTNWIRPLHLLASSAPATRTQRSLPAAGLGTRRDGRRGRQAPQQL